jgi:hypothetical protein
VNTIAGLGRVAPFPVSGGLTASRSALRRQESTDTAQGAVFLAALEAEAGRLTAELHEIRRCLDGLHRRFPDLARERSATRLPA